MELLRQSWLWLTDGKRQNAAALGVVVAIVVGLLVWEQLVVARKQDRLAEEAGGATPTSTAINQAPNAGVVVAGTDNIIYQGVTSEAQGKAVDAVVEPWRLVYQKQEELAKLRQQLGVSEKAVETFFAILDERRISPEQWQDRLTEIAKRYLELQEQVKPAPGDGPVVKDLKREAGAALAAGQLEQAETLLRRILETQDKAMEPAQREAAATAAQLGELAMTRLRYAEAANHYAAAARRVPPKDEPLELAYQDQEADAWWRQGAEFGDNPALLKAINRYRALVLRRPRDRVPLEWAMTELSSL